MKTKTGKNAKKLDAAKTETLHAIKSAGNPHKHWIGLYTFCNTKCWKGLIIRCFQLLYSVIRFFGIVIHLYYIEESEKNSKLVCLNLES
jgi:uncharacterized membrane protein